MLPMQFMAGISAPDCTKCVPHRYGPVSRVVGSDVVGGCVVVDVDVDVVGAVVVVVADSFGSTPKHPRGLSDCHQQQQHVY